MKKIVLAGGCFWGVEEFFSRIKGVQSTQVGYANGISQNPTYQEVCTGKTNHTEACMIEYNEAELSLQELLDQFWSVVDPTTLNKQGPDIGTQYRSGIYFTDPEELDIILASKEREIPKYNKPIATEIEPLTVFFNAEEYHQRYLKKNPKGYCHIKF